jgi:hypothetical protein
MSIYTTKPRGVYAKVDTDWIPVLHLLNLGEGDTVEIMTMDEKAKLTRINGEWIPVATLIDSAGDPVSLASSAQAVINASMPAFYETIPSGAVAASVIAGGTLSPGAGWYATRITGPARDISIATEFLVKNGTVAAGRNGLGLYTRVGTTFTRVGGSLVANASGTSALQSFAPTATITNDANPETYLVFGMSDATHTIDRMGGEVVKTGATFESFFLAAGTLAIPAAGQPLPATITGMAATSIIPWIVAR